MPAYNGIRGYWNEVRVNSNYKSKNAVPQGTELEAGMQTKRKKSRYVFWKTEVLFTTLFFAALLFAGCSVEQTNRTKISDLDYTIALEAAPFGLALNSQFFRPTVNGLIAFSLRLLDKLQ